MPIICYVLLAHYLIDWCWQGEFIATNKHKNWMVMLAHVAAWTLGVCAVLEYFHLFVWWKFVMLFVGHWAMDKLKCFAVCYFDSAEMFERSFKNFSCRSDYEASLVRAKYTLLFADQLFHLAQLIICCTL